MAKTTVHELFETVIMVISITIVIVIIIITITITIITIIIIRDPQENVLHEFPVGMPTEKRTMPGSIGYKSPRSEISHTLFIGFSTLPTNTRTMPGIIASPNYQNYVAR